MRTRLFVFLLSVFLLRICMAQPDATQYKFKRLDVGKGLSHNQVTCILKDRKGFMWFGTMAGLNRYDGYQFKIFRHDTKDSTSIDDDFISNILELPNGCMLVTTRAWMNIYDPQTESFTRFTPPYFEALHLPNVPATLTSKANNGDLYLLYSQDGLYKYDSIHKTTSRVDVGVKTPITWISKNKEGNFWLAFNNGSIALLNTASGRIIYRKNLLNTSSTEPLNYRVFADSDNELWLFGAGDVRGVFHYKPLTGALELINKDTGRYRLNTNLVMGLLEDNQGRIWICTDHGGVNIFNKTNGSISYVVNNSDDNNSLSQNSIISTYKDENGIIWIGTYKKGLNTYHESIIKFPLYRNRPSDVNSLSYDDVNRFAEDAKGNLWIGTNGGGLIYFDRAKGSFRQYRNNPANTNSLSSDIIVSLLIDKTGKLWIGTYYGGLDCFDGTTFTHYQHRPSDNTSIADNRIWEIYEDHAANMWIGTLGSGMDRFDREHNIFYHYSINTPNTIHSNFVSIISETIHGDLWIGTAAGLDLLNQKNGSFTHYDYNAADPASLSNGNVLAIHRDKKGRTWIGTREGLNLFKESTGKFEHFTIENGLPDNTILNILEDDHNALWIATPKGLSNLAISPKPGTSDEVTISVTNYDESDGLQGLQFNEKAAFKTRSGELVFGGPNGFNIFQPASLIADQKVPRLVFTDLQVFNRSIHPGEEVNGRVPLHQSISYAQGVSLNYNQNVIAIEFAALNYSNAEKIKYAYMLSGFKNEWLVADNKTRKAVFTNLDPGHYTFFVKTARDNGTWNNNAIQLDIEILPPFWKSSYAYLLYVLVIAIALYVGRIMIIRKAKARFAIEQERLEAQRMHELDLMKIKFFTNVSHEFRTPLSLIIAPVDKMIGQAAAPAQKEQLQLIRRNARRLLNLVNQLLDFRKMEEQELRLQSTDGDIIQYVSDVSHSFSDVANKKNISFSFHASAETFYTSYDHDKIERILFNLLSNAFKFTPENGHVGVSLSVRPIQENAGLFEVGISVQDTGIGINAAKHEQIFERFFQDDVPGSMVNQGSGIGLAITREFVKLHGGTIDVVSEPGKGSSFIVTLPMLAVTAAILAVPPSGDPAVDILSDPDVASVPAESLADESRAEVRSLKGAISKKSTVLLVEDNDDFRFYLKDNLKEYFNILEAMNGKLGWQKALAAHPDLVVSDISMPEMDGTELCKKIKTDPRTRHIPVILLTALAGEAQQLKGLETGANDYMTKPFNFEILLSKIRNQLLQQQQIKKTYQKQVEAKPAEFVLTESPGEKFLQQVLQAIEKNMSNADFSVEDLSKSLFMSRVALYKRLLSLTGKTPLEFIRQIRLKRAAQLLSKTEMTISEVAYEVGFNNPKYFSRYFKAEFDKLPSEIKSEKGAG